MKKLLAATALLTFSTASMASVQTLNADPHSQQTEDFIVSNIQETHKDAPISQELVGNIVTCQYNYIVDQYSGVVSDKQLMNGLVGLAVFHKTRGMGEQIEGNFLTNEDYYKTFLSCNSRYEYRVRQELEESRKGQ